jgi:hypothetical protein
MGDSFHQVDVASIIMNLSESIEPTCMDALQKFLAKELAEPNVTKIHEAPIASTSTMDQSSQSMSFLQI